METKATTHKAATTDFHSIYIFVSCLTCFLLALTLSTTCKRQWKWYIGLQFQSFHPQVSQYALFLAPESSAVVLSSELRQRLKNSRLFCSRHLAAFVPFVFFAVSLCIWCAKTIDTRLPTCLTIQPKPADPNTHFTPFYWSALSFNTSSSL